MDNLINSIPYLTLLITFIGVLVAMYHFRRQMNVNIFVEYTKRYDAIMDKFPDEAFATRINSEILPEESSALTMACLKYLNLCSEEFHLYSEKLTSPKVWDMWDDEIKRVLRSPMFKREWKKLENEFKSFPDFITFVENAQDS